jgi:hypothetical protein
MTGGCAHRQIKAFTGDDVMDNVVIMAPHLDRAVHASGGALHGTTVDSLASASMRGASLRGVESLGHGQHAGPKRRSGRALASAGLLAAALGVCATAPDANAALGARAETGEAIRGLHALAMMPRVGAMYTRRTTSTPEGGSATEFVDATGVVFAVAWEGPIAPNLQQLLGVSAHEFKAAQQRQMRQQLQAASGDAMPADLRAMRVDDGDLVAQFAGRPRAFRGFAYLRSALPASFDVRQLAP